jgi:signal transduction histidine kinase
MKTQTPGADESSIVIVDDDESRRYSKARALRSSGFLVFEAGTGQEGLELIRIHLPRLAIVDVGLPDMSGLEVCRRVKGDPTSASVAVLQISATFVSEADTVASLNSGADASLIEPIEPPVLIATVRAMIRTRLAEEAAKAALEREQSARANAEEANRIKDEFLAVLSHELRSPLGAILTWVTLLRNEGTDKAQLEQGLAAIERNARLQTKLVDDLLDVSKIISGKTTLDAGLVEIGPAIESALESVRAAAEAKDIRLEAFVSAGVGPLHADAARLQQVIWNLLSNAVKFTSRGGSVRVEVESKDSQAVIRVIDTGRGISSEFLPYVFERFRQADSSTSRAESGLGLGLAIVRHTVELHGGTVRAESPGTGQGTTFTVMLPLPASRPVSSGTPAAPAHSELQRLDGLRVLVVDDDDDAREVITAVVESGGAAVVATDRVASALQALTTMRFDVVVSDIGMPFEDGYALIKRIRELDSYRSRRLPALALTAYANTSEIERIRESGFDDTFTKPVEARELIAAIGRLARARSTSPASTSTPPPTAATRSDGA